MKRLIVNADDFGLTAGVNRAIIEAFERGIVTSTSLMAGGKAFEEAVNLASRHPGLGIGVHLTLVNGRPVSAPERVPSLVRPDGTFYRSPFEFVARLRLGRIRSEDVDCELWAQIRRALDAGVRVTHVDGHKHLHIYPQVLDVLINVMREFGIKWMRLPVESPSSIKSLYENEWNRLQPVWFPSKHRLKSVPLPGFRTGSKRSRVSGQTVSHFLVWRAAKSGQRKLIEAGIGSPDNFFGLFDTGSMSEPLLRAILEKLPDGTSEIMCHPGYDDAELRGTGTRLGSQRERELQALTSPAVRDLIEQTGIELINYGDIA